MRRAYSESSPFRRFPAPLRRGVCYDRPVRLLCLSDIHGQLDALAAVLATAERTGYDRILVAGDLCFPGPEPLGTWRRLMQLGAICVQGVGDRALATLSDEQLEPRDDFEQHRLARLRATRRELGDAILSQLARLPTTHRQPLPDGGELVLVHGSPVDPLEPLTHDMADDALVALLGPEPPALLLCGGAHVPFDRVLEPAGAPAGPAAPVRIVNLGSVGEAPDGDGSGAQFAHATFVLCSVDGIEVEQFVVPLGRGA